MRSLPQAPATPDTPSRDWNFSYADAGATELSAIQDPLGETSSFSSQTFQDGALVLRGVSQATQLDPASGASHTQSWFREAPSAGGTWTVRHREAYAPAEPTEARSTVYGYRQAEAAAPGKAILTTVQIQGVAGSSLLTSYEPEGSIRIAASGMPKRERLRTVEALSGAVTGESLIVNGEQVQTIE